jgi:hypothetical protein
MSTDAAQWRKLLISHCAFTTMQPADLAYADTLKTCTGAIIKVCLCMFFSRACVCVWMGGWMGVFVCVCEKERVCVCVFEDG